MMSDLAAAVAIETRANRFPWPASQMAATFTNRDRAWVYEVDNQVVGYAIYSVVLDEASLLNIAIHPSFQGRGLGRRVLEQTLSMIVQGGANVCFLEVRRSNDRAATLYESIGFRIVGERKDYYPSERGSEDAFVMRCDLQHWCPTDSDGANN